MRIPFFVGLLGLSSLPFLSQAQSSAPVAPAPAAVQWHLLDPKADGVQGISAQRAYRELLTTRVANPVLVAVIDGGIDTTHADLKRVLWRNAKEIAGNGKDDDRNGYVDDVYGWNFLGGKDGRNVNVESYEDTRLYAKLKPLYDGKARAAVPEAKRAEYDLYQQVKKSYKEHYEQDHAQYAQIKPIYEQTQQLAEKLRQELGVTHLDTATLRNPVTQDEQLREVALMYYLNLRQYDQPDLESVLAEMKDAYEQNKNLVEFSLDPAFNPRTIVGDNPEDTKDRSYGNRDVMGPDPMHGTHVAGIIAADRQNNLGVLGVAGGPVRIMAVRAVPNGDERDKDVANAIRYAVDNGAQIINMSFGKYFSPQRQAVEDAIKYAESKGVLLVHSAGNEANNLDQVAQFPAARTIAGQPFANLLTVGAAARTADEHLVADFSNYSPQQVDVFAPGVQIYSTLPGSQYGNLSGTSMAAPVVAGIAAVLKSYFPRLSAQDLKRIIMQSAVPTKLQVRQPGTDKLVDFSTLSSTGALVNLYQAVLLAQQQDAATPKK
ncbi:S8 family serine peptidase [Hymenobacter sp. BT18]|uniref:S8 family peptidase n=1 Tax=Hymenobacter sp. BT18 TaxID=2835648 RepID=UPI00143EE843|nr:S8 family peptidase [Hymenobacter sp. BT18]QIX62608.1 S8 family serine peptidase [Hymenobacter sp. BT18]